MANLTNARHDHIVVPDAAAKSYLAQGWVHAGSTPVEVEPKRTARRKPAAKPTTKKGASDAVSVRADSHSGTAKANPGPVQP